MAAVFLSYRREDGAAYAGRLYDRLCERFGAANVFMDVDDIRPGEDFAKAIERHVGDSRVALVLIGAGWLDARDAADRRRLDDAEDFVRREIAAALGGSRLVIPVLVDGAAMPGEDALPEDIRALARAQAVELSDTRFGADAARLMDRLVEAGVPVAGRFAGAAGRRGRLAAAAALLLAAIGGALWLGRGAGDAAAAFAGRWQAEVQYDWGATHRERFRFEVVAGELVGSAGFLGVARGIEEVRVEGTRLSFVTRSDEVLGEATRPTRHRYLGEAVGGEIRFAMRTEGGFSSHPPVRFVARRLP